MRAGKRRQSGFVETELWPLIWNNLRVQIMERGVFVDQNWRLVWKGKLDSWERCMVVRLWLVRIGKLRIAM